MTCKLHASLTLLLLVVLLSQAYAGTSLNASQTGTAQVAQSNEQVAGFDNSMAMHQFRSRVAEMLSAGELGFFLGAAIVVVQTLRRRAVPASARTIVLDL
jgi:hypothetical protein